MLRASPSLSLFVLPWAGFAVSNGFIEQFLILWHLSSSVKQWRVGGSISGLVLSNGYGETETDRKTLRELTLISRSTSTDSRKWPVYQGRVARFNVYMRPDLLYLPCRPPPWCTSLTVPMHLPSSVVGRYLNSCKFMHGRINKRARLPRFVQTSVPTFSYRSHASNQRGLAHLRYCAQGKSRTGDGVRAAKSRAVEMGGSMRPLTTPHSHGYVVSSTLARLLDLKREISITYDAGFQDFARRTNRTSVRCASNDINRLIISLVGYHNTSHLQCIEPESPQLKVEMGILYI